MEIYKKLKEEFPSAKDGLILGQAKCIVGQFGYEVVTTDYNGIKHSTKYQENDLIPVVKFNENGFYSSEQSHDFLFDYHKFKGIHFDKFTS